MSIAPSIVDKRCRELIEAKTSAGKRFVELEDATQIPRNTWRSFWSNGTRPSAPLLESLCKAWPQHAFWLMTGIEDALYGHVSPSRPNLNTASAVTASIFGMKIANEEWGIEEVSEEVVVGGPFDMSHIEAQEKIRSLEIHKQEVEYFRAPVLNYGPSDADHAGDAKDQKEVLEFLNQTKQSRHKIK